jgi:hypothetical protein
LAGLRTLRLDDAERGRVFRRAGQLFRLWRLVLLWRLLVSNGFHAD